MLIRFFIIILSQYWNASLILVTSLNSSCAHAFESSEISIICASTSKSLSNYSSVLSISPLTLQTAVNTLKWSTLSLFFCWHHINLWRFQCSAPALAFLYLYQLYWWTSLQLYYPPWSRATAATSSSYFRPFWRYALSLILLLML